MNNTEKLNKQLSALADLMSLEFTPEELKRIEEAYDRHIAKGNEEWNKQNKEGVGED